MRGKAAGPACAITKQISSTTASSRHSISPRLVLLGQSIRARHSSTTASPPVTSASSGHGHAQFIRPLVPPPDARSGPLLERLPNRDLPNIDTNSSRRIWLTTLPIFIALITVSSLAIFNYQKTSSSTVNSILYALRTHPVVRDLLGDEIYFASKVPWISGELNQLHGNIDISFWVKGTRGKAQTRFVSVRRTRNGYFETLEWSLKLDDGREVQLLELEETKDPMRSVAAEME